MPKTRVTTEAYILPSVGGCVDAIGLLTLHDIYVSHMSGNTAALGAFFGEGQWVLGWPHLIAVPIFVLGLFLGYLIMLPRPSPWRSAVILLIEALLLCLLGGLLLSGPVPSSSSPMYVLWVIPPLLAMGLQNATLRQIGRSTFPTTYVTGVLDTLAKSAAAAILDEESRRLAVRDIRRSAGIWIGYVLGGLAGGLGVLRLGDWTIFVPALALLALAVNFWRQGERLEF